MGDVPDLTSSSNSSVISENQEQEWLELVEINDDEVVAQFLQHDDMGDIGGAMCNVETEGSLSNEEDYCTDTSATSSATSSSPSESAQGSSKDPGDDNHMNAAAIMEVRTMFYCRHRFTR